MRVLLGEGRDVAGELGLHEAYAAPRRDWVRANFVASADGAASVDGRSGGLGSPADQQVLGILRAHADVVLVGAGTARAEDYGPVRHSPARTRLREQAGLSGSARLAVVTGTMALTGAERWLTEAPAPPVLLTTARSARPVPGAEVLVCGEQSVDPVAALAALAGLGLRHVLCEGGPGLLAQLAGAGLLDELCLTLSPLLAGPGAPRIVRGEPWAGPRPARLTQLLEDGGLLFARYQLPGRRLRPPA